MLNSFASQLPAHKVNNFRHPENIPKPLVPASSYFGMKMVQVIEIYEMSDSLN